MGNIGITSLTKVFPCGSCLFFLLFAGILLLTTGCAKDDPGTPGLEKVTRLSDNTITVSNIAGIPATVSFDKLRAEIKGADWAVVGTVEADFINGQAVLTLPEELSADKLIRAVRSSKSDPTGYWHAASDDNDAMMAALGDITACDGDRRVGRIFLTDWPQQGSTVGKFFVYYMYACRAFNLSGSDGNYAYDASFGGGWNAYAGKNGSETRADVLYTTSFSAESSLDWRFESWVY